MFTCPRATQQQNSTCLPSKFPMSDKSGMGFPHPCNIWIASINFLFKFQYRFCPTSDNQDGRQNGRHLSISAVVVTLAQSFLIRFLPNFIYGLLPSTFFSSSNIGFVRHPINKMADRMAGWPPPINIRCRGHSSSVIFNQISSKLHIWIASINLSFNIEYGFCSTSDNQDGRQNGRLATTYQYSLSWSL